MKEEREREGGLLSVMALPRPTPTLNHTPLPIPLPTHDPDLNPNPNPNPYPNPNHSPISPSAGGQVKDGHDDRKELWSFQETTLLLDLYDRIFFTLGRGMVRKSDWKLMADQLAAQTATAADADRKTPEQCKNRIEYLRKHYKKEKARSLVTSTDSPWAFYKKLERLVEIPYFKQAAAAATLAAAAVAVAPNGYGDMTAAIPRVSTPNAAASANAAALDDDALSPDNSHPDDDDDDGDDDETAVTITDAKAPHAQGRPGLGLGLGLGLKPSKKKRKLVVSLGQDLREGLTEFAQVIEKIERTKMELIVMLERQRAEQEQKRIEMDMERTRMLLQNQLEVAKLIFGSSKGSSGGGGSSHLPETAAKEEENNGTVNGNDKLKPC